MTTDNGPTIAACVKESDFFKKFGYRGTWISGSSTTVHPIQVWTNRKEVEIQLTSQRWRGQTQSLKSLIRKLEKAFSIKSWHLDKGDGSCPASVSIFYN